MARLHASVLVIDFSATARLVLSRRTGLSTGPNKIFCPAGIGSSACPHIIGTSLWFVGVSVGLVPRSDIFQSPDSHTTAMMPLLDEPAQMQPRSKTPEDLKTENLAGPSF